VRTISNESQGNGASSNGPASTPNQSKPSPMKTDQEILEELKQAGSGERRRSVGLTAFIILLAIVIAVFTAMNRREEKQVEEQTANTQEETQAGDQDEAADSAEPAEEAPVAQPAPTAEPQPAANGEAVGETPTPESTHTDTEYTESAQVGEGVTHLARRATASYLSTKNITDFAAEKKIFVEDYLADHSVPVYLENGETRTFSVTLMDEAIAQANALTPAQLENLQQYVYLVPGL
jgi:hypothetical protein